MPKVVRVKDGTNKRHKVQIPVGHQVVALEGEGRAQAGDLFLNMWELEKGTVHFQLVEKDDVGHHQEWSLLIRKG